MATKFQFGQTVITPGAQGAIPEPEVYAALGRHGNGDWGKVCEEDAAQNEWALKNDARIISIYESEDGAAFWIITEADRSSTTILLPEEY